MGTSKAVRFSQEEIKEIETFLKNNPFLDFSSLTRLAVAKFIEDPQMEFKANKNNKVKNEITKVQ